MAEADFNPQQVDVPATKRWTGNRLAHTFHPAPGSTVAVVYIEASANLAAIDAALNEIDGLATNFQKRVWTAAAVPGRRPEVEVGIVVRKHALG